jgi:tetratricopeptide (TPR) repeat protein
MVQIQDVTPVDDDAARSGERLRLAGNAAYNSGDFEAAARSYRDSLEAAPLPSPSAPKALGNLAKALLMLGHPGEALANAERYVQACPPGTPDAAKARFRKGEALEATGDLRAAREAYRDAAKDAPGDEKVRGALARVSETIERRRRESAEPGVSAKAETRFETAERETSRARAPPRATKTLTLDDEKKNQAAYSRAKRAIREARYEEAVEAFACYTLPPSRPDRALSLFLNRARALTELGRHEEALRDARAAVSADQESPRARYRLGVTALAAAEAAAEQATKMVSVLSHGENDKTDKTKTFDLRSRAEALAREARDEGFGYGARLENVFEKYDDASAFAKGREACETFLRTTRDFSLPFSDKATDKGDPVIVDPERKPTKSTRKRKSRRACPSGTLPLKKKKKEKQAPRRCPSRRSPRTRGAKPRGANDSVPKEKRTLFFPTRGRLNTKAKTTCLRSASPCASSGARSCGFPRR